MQKIVYYNIGYSKWSSAIVAIIEKYWIFLCCGWQYVWHWIEREGWGQTREKGSLISN